MISQGISHTAYDVMREYMIIGAELDGKYQIPMLDRYTGHPGEDTVDFKDSFSLKIKNHRKLTVNFYIHDYEFEKIWNNPDRYLEHLKCFHSVIGPDFSMAVGENGMPFAMNIYQKYRNHALSHYLSMNGIKVIPNVSIPPEYMQSVAVVIDVDNLTQSQIVEILSNDGAWKGLYYKNGQLYISFNAALGGELTLGGEKNGNGYLKIKDANNAAKGLIDRSGYAVFTSYEENSKYMKYTGVQFSSDGIFPVDIKKFFDDEVDIEIENSENWGISWNDNSLNVYATEVSADTGTFENLTVTNPASFAKSPKIEDMEYTTSSNTICWDGRTGYKQLMLKSSSSKRYKDIGNNISEQEIEEWYNIEPTWAKYKDGYLVKGDENEGRYIPMFIAEDVEEYFPEATRHANGLVEDWNERIMIPAMFAMIKSQKSEIDLLKQELNEIKQLLRKE